MLKRLSVSRFRNLGQQTIEFSPFINVLVGKNGQGKTNVVEAAQLVQTARSFRTGNPTHFMEYSQDLSTDSSQEISIGAVLKGELKRGSIRDVSQIQFSAGKILILANGKRVSGETLASKYPTIVFAPESLEALKGGPEVRRALLDEAARLTEANAGESIQMFLRVLKARNRVLKGMLLRSVSPSEGSVLLDSLSEQFLACSWQLIQLRQQVVTRLNSFFRFAARDILGNSGLELEIRYPEGEVSHVEFKKKVEQVRGQELALGSSLEGPHRHDLRFLYHGKDARFFCSQGQQRTLILAFKIAQIVYHGAVHSDYPLLILDDVLSELDSDKRLALIRFLKSLETQTLLTTTDISVPSEIGSNNLSVMRIAEGCVEKA